MGRVAERFRRRRRYKQFAWAADECLRASRVFAEDMGVNDWWKLRANDLYEDARQLWSEWQEMCRRDQVRIGMAVLRQIYDEAARKEYEAAAEKV